LENNTHLAGADKSRFSKKSLKRQFIKLLKSLNYARVMNVSKSILIFVTCFCTIYSHLKLMEEKEVRNDDKLVDLRRNPL
jgi:hypothetical protein